MERWNAFRRWIAAKLRVACWRVFKSLSLVPRMSAQDLEAPPGDGQVDSDFSEAPGWWPDIIGIDNAELESDVDIFTYTKATRPVNVNANPDLCRFCRVFFDTWDDLMQARAKWEDGFSTTYYNSMIEIQDSATRGCSMCSLLACKLRRLQKSRIDLTFAENLAPYMKLLIPSPSLNDRSPTLKMGYTRGLPKSSNLLSVQMSPVQESDQRVRRNASQNLLAELRCSNNDDFGAGHGSTALIRQWIKDCGDNHPACRQEPQQALPTRLIQIDGKPPRLRLTEGRTDCSTYCTLSHCWGTLDTPRLRKSNLQVFLQEIPSASLCKTFRDAIEIARALGFSWLWIDSLCIVQDDKEDWLQESALMSSVYGGSYLNIAATAAPDGETGCLFERYPTDRVNRQLEVQVDGKRQIYQYAEKQLVYGQLRKSPLAKRAWVLQERLLAPRNLHFATSQLFWECKTKYACESFPHGIPEDFLWDYAAIPKKGLRNSWPQIVTFYSSCSLTYRSDKMVAISGIARSIQQHTGDEYIAGLWRETFLSDLLWHNYDRGHVSPRVRGPNCLPSWTWAAVNTEVLMCTHTILIPYIELTDINLNLANTEDPFGHVNGGTLTIKSTQMKRVRIPFTDHTSLLDPQKYIHYLIFNNWDYDSYDEHHGDVFLVPIAYTELAKLKSLSFNALLLQRTGRGNGQYERVGVHYSSFQPPQRYDLDVCREEIGGSIERWLGSEDGYHAPPREGDYVDVQTDADGRIWYVIDIV